MHLSRVADTALPAEVRSAVAAEQLGGQQIFFLGLIAGRGFSVFGHPFLHPVKEFPCHKGRDALRRYGSPEGVFSNIPAIVQNPLDTAIVHLLAPGVPYSLLIEPVPNLGHGSSFGIPLEYLSDKGCSQGVRLEMPVTVNDISHGAVAPIVLGLEDILGHSP